MTPRRILAPALALLAALAGPARADDLPYSPTAQLSALYETEGSSTTLGVKLVNGSGKAFEWMATLDEPGGDVTPSWLSLGVYPVDVFGRGGIDLVLPADLVASLPPVYMRGVFVESGAMVQTPSTELTELAPPPGERLDFDWGLGAVPIAAGELVSDTQPWAGIMTICADNADPTHPDAVVALDSSAPTGGDDDLVTPGPGPGNDEALGVLVCIAENAVDADGDGLVDEPDDEAAGGLLVFEFPGPVDLTRVRLVDVDEPGGQVRLYEGTGLVATRDVAALGDNGVQWVEGARGVTRLEIDVAGSFAVGELELFACEAVVNLDETSTGVPLPLEAGADAGAAVALFEGLGLAFGAVNAEPTHPDAAIVFDTSDPSGEDEDLATPGAGPGNTVARGQVLVIAEDDVDLDGDGLVDDPGDETAGGVLAVEFTPVPGRFRGATVLDVEASETSWIEIWVADDAEPVVIPLAGLGDGSSQTIETDLANVECVEFHLGGSAALAEIRVCPPPEDEPPQE